MHFLKKSFLMLFALLPFTFGDASATPTNEPETYTKLNLSLGGYYYSGNLNQVQGNLQGHLGISSPTIGADILTNGYRLWSKTSSEAPYKRVGDDFFLTALPFWYFVPKIYVAGLGRYESSKVLKLDHRIVTGLGLGYAPVRTKDWLIRIALIPSYEWAKFPGTNFKNDVNHDGNQRHTIRAAIISNGWFRQKNSPITYRYFAQLWPNPLDIDDIRANLVSNADIKIVGPLALRFTALFSYDPSILEGRKSHDFRSTFGVVIKAL